MTLMPAIARASPVLPRSACRITFGRYTGKRSAGETL